MGGTLLSALVSVGFIAISASLSIQPRSITGPVIISHRGASGYVPEHTLPAYRLAMDLGTDYIEPDMCLTKDKKIVIMHDLLLDDTTDVASKFPKSRQATHLVAGSSDQEDPYRLPNVYHNVTGYFVADFTLSEIKTLRLNQRLPMRSKAFDGIFEIPTLQEVMAMVQEEYSRTKHLVGIYIELKHPSFHNSYLNTSFEDIVVSTLQQGGYALQPPVYPINEYVSPVVIECFDALSLQKLRSLTTIPLIYLMEEILPSQWSDQSLKNITAWADGIGPMKAWFLNDEVDCNAGQKLAKIAHKYKLWMHPWTFRQDQGILPEFNNDFMNEQGFYYCCMGMQGLFTEFPDLTRQVIASTNLVKNIQGNLKSTLSGNAKSSDTCKKICSAFKCNAPFSYRD